MERNCVCEGKNLDRFIQPTVLQILFREDMHGFRLIREISELPMYAGQYPDPTGLYRYLKKMEGSGLLSSYGDIKEGFSSKRIYHITEAGIHCLENWSVTLEEYAMQILELVANIKEIMKEN